MTRGTLLALAAAEFALGCQTYDFEPVEPLAVAHTTQDEQVRGRNATPDLMLLVDKSLSMSFEAYPGGPSRMDELKTAMNEFLTGFEQKPVARVGLLIYPQENADSDGVPGCSPARLEDIDTAGRGVPIPAGDDDASLKDAARRVKQTLLQLVPSGGTPTAASLAVLGNYAPLATKERQHFVLLLTDGLPNCNAAQPLNNCSGATACSISCSDSSWRPGMGCCTQTQASLCSGKVCAKGCLDASGTVDAIRALHGKGIKTIVVGFGADLVSGAGPHTLNAMAAAGGFSRLCPNGTDAECGTNNRCLPTKTCEKQYYAAGNARELADALARITEILPGTCERPLSAVPPDPPEKHLAVLVDGVHVDPGPDMWRYESGKVVFQGALCRRLEQSTQPVQLEFRILEPL